MHCEQISALDDAKQRIQVEPLPVDSASASRFVEWMKWNDVIIKGWLKEMGIELSSGALTACDPKHGGLAIRGLPGEHEIAEVLLQPLGDQPGPTEVHWRQEIIAATALDIVEAMHHAAVMDVSAVRDKLAAQGKNVAVLSGQGLPGSILEASNSTNQPNGYTLELDSVVSSDRQTIDFNVVMEQHTPRQFRVSTALSGLSGSTQLLGVWRPTDDKTLLHAVFATLSAVTPSTKQGSRALALIEKYGETVLPTPKTLPIDTELPPGMVRRRFRVPPDYLSGTGPRDPFGTSLSTRKTARNVLEDQGVQVPVGSSCVFSPGTSMITAINTPENMKLIEAFVNTLYPPPRRQVCMQAYVVEAPAEKVLAWDRRGFGTSDHSRVYTEIMSELSKQRANLVDSVFLSTKPGSWVTVASGVPKMATPNDSNTKPELEGLSLELGAVIGQDGRMIDCNYSIEIEDHRINSTIHLQDNVPRLAATWSLVTGKAMRILILLPTIVTMNPVSAKN